MTPDASRVLAIIPARGGSKRLPRKNLLLLGGIPLIAYAIHQARRCPLIGRTIVSTDDPAIAAIARAWGAEVPFLRPEELGADDTPDLPVFAHALQWLEAHGGYRPDTVVHLRPTTPLRRIADIGGAIRALAGQPAADSVRSVVEPPQSPYKMFTIGAAGFLEPLLTLEGVAEPYNAPHQLLPRVFMHRGVVDVARRDTILRERSMSGRNILPYQLSTPAVSINYPEDLPRAEHLLRQGGWDGDVPVAPAPVVLLARHGQSGPLRGLAYDAAGEVGLTDVGRDQARSLGERFRREGVAAVYASPLARARETAEIASAVAGVPLRLDERLREQALSRSATDESALRSLRDRCYADFDHAADDGESVRAAAARLADFLSAPEAKGRERIAAVSHGRIIESFLMLRFGAQPYFREAAARIAEASVTAVGAVDGELRLLVLNDSAHLGIPENR